MRALVFLDREDSATGDDGPRLHAASRPELVKTMIRTAFAPHVASQDLLAGLTRLADAAVSLSETG